LEKKDYPLIKDARILSNIDVLISLKQDHVSLSNIKLLKLFKRRRSLFEDAKEVSSWNRREGERAYKVQFF